MTDIIEFISVDASAVEFGIDPHENAELQSLKDIYLRPVIKAAKRFKPESKKMQSSKAP